MRLVLTLTDALFHLLSQVLEGNEVNQRKLLRYRVSTVYRGGVTRC